MAFFGPLNAREKTQNKGLETYSIPSMFRPSLLPMSAHSDADAYLMVETMVYTLLVKAYEAPKFPGHEARS